MSSHQALVASEQLGRLYIESVSQFEQIAEAYVALTALDTADVRAVHPAAIRQTLLRDTGGNPQLSNGLSECGVFRRSGSHWQARMLVYSL